MTANVTSLARYLPSSFRVLALDVGGAKQTSDRSAIASWLVELPGPITQRHEPRYTLEHAKRMPPGLGSEGVADEYCRQWQFYAQRHHSRVLPVVDSNGIGATVFQILKGRGLRPLGLVASGSGHEIGQPKFYDAASDTPAGELSVPTSIMVTRAKALKGNGQLRIAEDIADYDALLSEFVGTPIKHSPSGRSVNFEAAAGGHDDLIAASLYGLVAADWLLGRPMMARLFGNFMMVRRPCRAFGCGLDLRNPDPFL